MARSKIKPIFECRVTAPPKGNLLRTLARVLIEINEAKTRNDGGSGDAAKRPLPSRAG